MIHASIRKALLQKCRRARERMKGRKAPVNRRDRRCPDGCTEVLLRAHGFPLQSVAPGPAWVLRPDYAIALLRF